MYNYFSSIDYFICFINGRTFEQLKIIDKKHKKIVFYSLKQKVCLSVYLCNRIIIIKEINIKINLK